MFTLSLIVLVLGTILIVWVSRSSLRDTQKHGFYRFFAWEIILVLFVLNMKYWIINPFSLRQIVAWALLIISLVLIYLGVKMFRQKGALNQDREDQALVGIEKTTQLVTSGVYGTIRHPFYASLLFLTWGIFFKHPTWIPFMLGLLASIFLFITAKKEEAENIAFFGEAYQLYMGTTKMFIPFIF